jgi:hypothetical protein
MKETDYEDWIEIAEQTARVEEELRELARMMSGSVPKSVHHQQWDRADDAMTKLKSDLENRFAEEHPDDWSTHDFYGTSDLTPARKMGEQDV